MSSMFLSHLLLPPNLSTPAMLGLENSQADVAKSAPYLHNANRRIITSFWSKASSDQLAWLELDTGKELAVAVAMMSW